MSIPITIDKLNEDDEKFKVVLSVVNAPAVKGIIPGAAVVTIIDDDGKLCCWTCVANARLRVFFPEPPTTKPPVPTLPPKPATTIRWEKAQYTISESDRKVEMCILVVGTSQVKATVVPQDLTATEKGTRLLIV